VLSDCRLCSFQEGGYELAKIGAVVRQPLFGVEDGQP
jgi:hypothetical protein